MMPNGWEWSVESSEHSHIDRVPLMREVPYETASLVDLHVNATMPLGLPSGARGKALSLNISSGGMLLLTDKLLEMEQVLRVHIPTPAPNAQIPTLAEVRWVRSIPFPSESDLYFVGLRFMF